MTDWFEEFKKSYNDYSSQDNEGFIPDRGAFKCGFLEAWHIRQKEIDRLRIEKMDMRHHAGEWEQHCIDCERITVRELLAEIDRLLAKIRDET